MSTKQQLHDVIKNKFNLNVAVSPDNETTTISMSTNGVSLLVGAITHAAADAGMVHKDRSDNPLNVLSKALAPALLSSFVLTVCEAQLAARGKSVTYDEKGTQVITPVTLQ